MTLLCSFRLANISRPPLCLLVHRVARLATLRILVVPSFGEVLLGGGCEDELLSALTADQYARLKAITTHSGSPSLPAVSIPEPTGLVHSYDAAMNRAASKQCQPKKAEGTACQKGLQGDGVKLMNNQSINCVRSDTSVVPLQSMSPASGTVKGANVMNR